MHSEETAGTATWTDPAWRQNALSWADEELAAAGLRRDGEAEQPHVYPWSTVLRLPVDGDTVWLKPCTWRPVRWSPPAEEAECRGRHR